MKEEKIENITHPSMKGYVHQTKHGVTSDEEAAELGLDPGNVADIHNTADIKWCWSDKSIKLKLECGIPKIHPKEAASNGANAILAEAVEQIVKPMMDTIIMAMAQSLQDLQQTLCTCIDPETKQPRPEDEQKRNMEEALKGLNKQVHEDPMLKELRRLFGQS